MPKQSQIDKAAELQDALLESFAQALKDGTATAADRAALSRLLMANGWSIDPKEIPQGLRGYLTKTIDPQKFSEDDADLEVQ